MRAIVLTRLVLSRPGRDVAGARFNHQYFST
jgi:hypothetical protein